ncbi:MAG: ATP-dependent Clp protease adapter ClpS [Desulfovibrionales bacterium]|nr:MAG: ATP-dependent Clp protease adapter ClpS [Desulfovibrionales bacterium]
MLVSPRKSLLRNCCLADARASFRTCNSVWNGILKKKGEPLSVDISDPRIEGDVEIEDLLELPKRYKVLLHNDDYTTMEFVIHVLKVVFGKNENEAAAVMLKVHQEGVGVCGVYTAEIAEAKVALVQHMARKNGFPLKCTMEEV